MELVVLRPINKTVDIDVLIRKDIAVVIITNNPIMSLRQTSQYWGCSVIIY